MHKNLPVDEETHLKIKLAAANRKITIGAYLAELYESHARLTSLAQGLEGMNKGDVYRIQSDKKVTMLKCEEVLPIDN